LIRDRAQQRDVDAVEREQHLGEQAGPVAVLPVGPDFALVCPHPLVSRVVQARSGPLRGLREPGSEDGPQIGERGALLYVLQSRHHRGPRAFQLAWIRIGVAEQKRLR